MSTSERTLAPAPAGIPTHTFPANYQKHDHHLLTALCAWNRAHGMNKEVAELKMNELSAVLQDAALRRREEQFTQALDILATQPPRWPRLRATVRWFYREVICNGE
jgi:hypothetical protein